MRKTDADVAGDALVDDGDLEKIDGCLCRYWTIGSNGSSVSISVLGGSLEGRAESAKLYKERKRKAETNLRMKRPIRRSIIRGAHIGHPRPTPSEAEGVTLSLPQAPFPARGHR